MQYETNIDRYIISSVERVVNSTYFTKLVHGSYWYAKNDSIEVVIPLRIIVHLIINVLFKILLNIFQ